MAAARTEPQGASGPRLNGDGGTMADRTAAPILGDGPASGRAGAGGPGAFAASRTNSLTAAGIAGWIEALSGPIGAVSPVAAGPDGATARFSDAADGSLMRGAVPDGVAGQARAAGFRGTGPSAMPTPEPVFGGGPDAGAAASGPCAATTSSSPAGAASAPGAGAASAPGAGAAAPGPAVSAVSAGAGLIDQIRALEELKGAAAARQAVLATVFDGLQRAGQEALGVPATRLGKGVAEQLALARRDPPARGARHLGLARVLVREMPHTLHALSLGRITEWRATLLVRETACLSVPDRMGVDEAVAGDLDVLESLNDRALVGRVRALAYRADAAGFVAAREQAVGERTVSCRPAPGGMVFLSALLPLKAGVSALAVLDREASWLRNTGDPRSRGQVMADTLVERLTGAAEAANTVVEVQLVVTDGALFANGDDPAYLPGYGVIPAADARRLATPAADSGSNGPTAGSATGGGADGAGGGAAAAPSAAPSAGSAKGSAGAATAAGPAAGGPAVPGAVLGASDRVRIRRLFTAPGTGELVGMDSRARRFPASLQRFIRARDQVCRTPWCGAPIRHADHVTAWAGGGPTSLANGQGLCERCNQTKELQGWAAAVIAGPRHTVVTTTPTGHSYTSTAPPLPGTPPPGTPSWFPAGQDVPEGLDGLPDVLPGAPGQGAGFVDAYGSPASPGFPYPSFVLLDPPPPFDPLDPGFPDPGAGWDAGRPDGASLEEDAALLAGSEDWDWMVLRPQRDSTSNAQRSGRRSQLNRSRRRQRWAVRVGVTTSLGVGPSTGNA
ncbi:HNH endonuclease [Pseudarthrobacter sp. P1]|uniref:HNH endonuclease n=1 Tax=Pseudarthrobacter sp. P1 TaxID=3418418 RepID=UPI003CF1A3CC